MKQGSIYTLHLNKWFYYVIIEINIHVFMHQCMTVLESRNMKLAARAAFWGLPKCWYTKPQSSVDGKTIRWKRRRREENNIKVDKKVDRMFILNLPVSESGSVVELYDQINQVLGSKNAE
jgi:hypothetical protein